MSGKARKYASSGPIKRGERGKPFEPARREAVIACIEEGASIEQAARLAGCTKETIRAWLKSGRSDHPKHPEHKAFAQAFDAAEARGTHDVLKNLKALAANDTRAAVAILNARDKRFGGGLAAQRLREAKAAADLAEAKAAAAKKALEGGGEAAMIFGIEAVLDAPLDPETKAKIREAIADGRIKTITKWGLGEDE